MKKLLSLALALVLCLTLAVQAAAAGNLSPEAVYQAMTALKDDYPEGMGWTNDDYYEWSGGIYSGGYGCAGFAFMLSDAAFGQLPARMIEGDVSFSDVRVGDILRINNDGHSVIVLEILSDSVIIAEGNYNSSIHWGRSLSREKVESADYLITRYPEAPAEPEPPAEVTPRPDVPSIRFPDVSDGQWYAQAVEAIAAGGLVGGYSDGSFGPGNQVTLGEFCTILARACGLETYSQDGMWAYGAVRSCVSAGYIDLQDPEMAPKILNAPIPRKLAISAIQVAGALRQASAVDFDRIPDVDGTDVYDVFILAAYRSGLTQGGDTLGTFHPEDSLTRAELCQILYNADWTQPREGSGLSMRDIYQAYCQQGLAVLEEVFG